MRNPGSPSANWTPKRRRFVEEYLVDLNAADAARRAGYKNSSAYEIGHRLLGLPIIAEAIMAAQAERARRLEIKQDDVVRDLVEIKERCLQHKPVVDRQGKPVMVEGPNGSLGALYAFDPQGAVKAVELLGKHVGMWPNKVSVNLNKSHEDWLDDLAAEEANKKPEGTTLQ